MGGLSVVDIKVEKQELHAHAGNVDTAATAVGQAGKAADTVALGTDAFGLIFSFFVPQVSLFLSAEAQAIDAVGPALTASANGLRKASDALTGTDADTRITFEAVDVP